ncbi:iron complex transport system ATP-binding protein [Pseudochrobactrum asaccharolyticum]|uniref:Iron complex transport system ATP-binding protein n=2 Tax=Pseudochrobactrum asaccharolyticum TaxID=354351 RepID=A0A366DPM8_9HYPH|nr:iron complex transport system ATP-binding protein [Pseudochrobactrum asaccharolyticum]
MMGLEAKNITFSYGEEQVFSGLDLQILQGKITALVGANGSGKSTILKNLARILRPSGGTIMLDGQEIQNFPAKHIARKMAVLSQMSEAPAGLRVSDLVAYGRYPWQKGFGLLSDEDKEKIRHALELTSLTELAERDLGSLSGGQRQRVWIAMALAQDSEIILLDEPTTYLDMAHQLDVMQLLSRLNADHCKTIIMVLHDLNQAARFADHIIAIRQGAIIRQGSAGEIMCAEVMRDVFGIAADFFEDPRTGKPVCIPYATCTV